MTTIAGAEVVGRPLSAQRDGRRCRRSWRRGELAALGRRLLILYCVVGGSGLEPLASCVSSKYSNQLS